MSALLALYQLIGVNSLAWWPVLILVVVATAVDLRSRRIPNWLVLPFLTGGVVIAMAKEGAEGLGWSLAGIGVAVATTGILCWLRGMGMGDLKLCAAVGAWIGPSQMVTALVVTGLAGGAMALIWAACRGVLSESLIGSSDLVNGLCKNGFKPNPGLILENRPARAIPYAPAIAIGTLFSFYSL